MGRVIGEVGTPKKQTIDNSAIPHQIKYEFKVRLGERISVVEVRNISVDIRWPAFIPSSDKVVQVCLFIEDVLGTWDTGFFPSWSFR